MSTPKGTPPSRNGVPQPLRPSFPQRPRSVLPQKFRPSTESQRLANATAVRTISGPYLSEFMVSSSSESTVTSSPSTTSLHPSSSVGATESECYQQPPPIARSGNPSDIESGSSCPEFHSGPSARTKEHFRDISFLGPITLHRIFVLAWIFGTGSALYFLQNWIWPPDAVEDTTWTLLGIIWLIPLPSSLAFVVGILWFRHNTKLDKVERMEHNVAFRIVSRGINTKCLLSSIRRCQKEMKKNSMFPYLVEVVTDGEVFQAPDEPDVIHLKVPADYQTPHGAKFKARALHYASQHSIIPPETWVVHLDEESQPTSSVLKGIALMVAECERNGQTTRIGQGLILYHRGWKKHPFLTLADMRRTGDDLGHFFLQHNIGYTIFGLHGSFVVCRQDLEMKLGFDVGPRGSVTEDAWWILLAIEKGYRTMWCDGYMEEQATQGLMDFMKQRRRWYVGLFQTGVYCPVKVKHKVLLMLNTVSWIILPVVLPLQLVYLGLSFAFEKQIALPIRLLSNLTFSTTTLVYLSGLVINMREHGTPWWRGIFWLVLLVLGLPLFFVLEVASILMAFLSPFSKGAKGFHVVKKSGSTATTTTASIQAKTASLTSEAVGDSRKTNSS